MKNNIVIAILALTALGASLYFTKPTQTLFKKDKGKPSQLTKEISNNTAIIQNSNSPAKVTEPSDNQVKKVITSKIDQNKPLKALNKSSNQTSILWVDNEGNSVEPAWQLGTDYTDANFYRESIEGTWEMQKEIMLYENVVTILGQLQSSSNLLKAECRSKACRLEFNQVLSTEPQNAILDSLYELDKNIQAAKALKITLTADKKRTLIYVSRHYTRF